MAKWVCYTLTARSAFHFGERGVGMEEASVSLHSDTLFSALCLSLLELGVDLNSLLNAFPRVYFKDGKLPEVLPGEPPFRISSAFPFWTGQKEDQSVARTYLFPKPFLRVASSGEGDPQQAKALKKIQFVSQPVFEAMLAGEAIGFREENLVQGGKVWVTADEKNAIGSSSLWTDATQPHVTVDRVSSASQPYAVGQVRFADKAGLFFLVEYSNTVWRSALEKALRALGDSGVGGERSSGKGQFYLEIVDDFSLAVPANANGFTTLSLYWPLQPETQNGILSEASYGLVLRRGWIGAPAGMNLRRRGVRMLAEGSVFAQKPEGALADVKPLDPEEVPNVSHAVWRYGLAFSVPCYRAPEEKNA